MNRIWLSAVLATSLFSVPVYSADTTFHFMQIEQVTGGVNGDTTAQAIQLRMRGNFQNSVSFARLRVWDAQGLNPVIVINFTSNVTFHGCGRRVLITSSNFNTLTTPNTTPDFTMTNLIPASYLAAGSITFENNAGTIIYWRLSWGGANYTGSNAGSCTNDDSSCPSPGDFGPPWPDPLPSGGCQALQFQGACSAQSTTNAADYALTTGAAVFTNNAIQSFTVSVTPCCGNGVAEQGEDCSNCPADVPCPPGTECVAGVCESLCGNGVVDRGEDCSNCPADVQCPPGTECIAGVCETPLCGNGVVDPGEDCANCPADVPCPPGTECIAGVCQPLCGNGVVDPGEDCANCPADVPCPPGTVCVAGVCQLLCGNGVVDPGEDCSNCPEDVTCPPGTECIAGVCELPSSPADISGPKGPGFPDGCVDAFDLGTLLGAWCSSASDPDPPGDVDPPCEGCTSPNFALADISGEFDVSDGCVDAFDLAKVLAEWCSDAGGNPCDTCDP
ncbi:MAG: hypothetical protein IH830_12315 [Planctomycetes bacterium]|nr:hypothetical protein [Planctomycetota bacterium]